MPDLLEIVFENVPESEVVKMYLSLLNKAGEIDEFQCTENIGLTFQDSITTNQIESFIGLPDDATLAVKLRYLTINKYDIPFVLLRLVKYNNKIDIDFNFDESDIININIIELMSNLHAEVSDIAQKHRVKNWFGGVEPACDEDTQFFLNDSFLKKM